MVRLVTSAQICAGFSDAGIDEASHEVAPPPYLPPEIYDDGLKRLAADMYRTGEGMINRHDHKKTHEHDDQQNGGHHPLRR